MEKSGEVMEVSLQIIVYQKGDTGCSKKVGKRQRDR